MGAWVRRCVGAWVCGSLESRIVACNQCGAFFGGRRQQTEGVRQSRSFRAAVNHGWVVVAVRAARCMVAAIAGVCDSEMMCFSERDLRVELDFFVHKGQWRFRLRGFGNERMASVQGACGAQRRHHNGYAWHGRGEKRHAATSFGINANAGKVRRRDGWAESKMKKKQRLCGAGGVACHESDRGMRVSR